MKTKDISIYKTESHPELRFGVPSYYDEPYLYRDPVDVWYILTMSETMRAIVLKSSAQSALNALPNRYIDFALLRLEWDEKLEASLKDLSKAFDFEPENYWVIENPDDEQTDDSVVTARSVFRVTRGV